MDLESDATGFMLSSISSTNDIFLQISILVDATPFLEQNLLCKVPSQ